MAGGVIAALLVGAGVWALTQRGWAAGDGPFDLLPEGIGSKPLDTNTVYAASGRQYKITTYQRGASQTFHVAVAASGGAGGDWVSFIVDDKTGQRVLYRAHGSDQKALDALRGDFSL